MLILKKHNDYYDGVAGSTGIDKKIVFDRKMVEYEKHDIPEIFKYKRGDKIKFFRELDVYTILKFPYKINYKYFIVGFCGRLYVGWKIYREINKGIYTTDFTTEFTYDIDKIKQIIDYNNKYRNFRTHSSIDDNYRKVSEYDAMELFREYNTPIFIYDSDYERTIFGKHYSFSGRDKFIVNPILKDYEFYKIFDAYQAFQEISMFIGGVLGSNEKEIVEIDDKYKIAQHGFDKWSFRKEPNEK